MTELLRQMLERIVVRLHNVLRLVGLDRMRRADLAGGNGPSLGNIDGRGAGVTLRMTGAGRRFGRHRRGDVEDVELPARRGLNRGVFRGVMGDVVAIDDVVVPIPMARHQRRSLELESAPPTPLLPGVFRQWKHALVVVPGAQQVNGLHVRGRAKREIHLDRRHREIVIIKPWIPVVVVLLRVECVVKMVAESGRSTATQTRCSLPIPGRNDVRYEQEE